MEMHLFALEIDIALVRLMNTGEHLHECRFAGGIVTDQPEDLPVTEV
jgi:hypothetical protein